MPSTNACSRLYRLGGETFLDGVRPLVATGLLLLGLALSTFGLVHLVAKGYGAVSWGFLVVYIVSVTDLGCLQNPEEKGGILLEPS